MSRLYIKLFTGFYTHRKTLRLRAALGDDAYWIPPKLWAYAAENQPDGIFKDYSAAEIASLIGYNSPSRDASSMLQALLQAGFMDDKPLRIHDWREHNGFHQVFSDRARKASAARWSKPPSRPSPSIEIDIEREPSIAPSNASSIPPVLKTTDKISFERELKDVNAELRTCSDLKDYTPGTKKFNRVKQLLDRQAELRTKLGVVA